MIYLVILVLAASLSIGRLWMLQRRQKSHLQTVDGFRAGWHALSEPANPPPLPQRGSGRRSPHRIEATRRKATPHAAHRRPERLDPARRAAAKRRIAARRAARQF
ncbi:MAG: hypothetical protein ACRDJL_07300 [Actinomycetota bacterium]